MDPYLTATFMSLPSIVSNHSRYCKWDIILTFKCSALENDLWQCLHTSFRIPFPTACTSAISILSLSVQNLGMERLDCRKRTMAWRSRLIRLKRARPENVGKFSAVWRSSTASATGSRLDAEVLPFLPNCYQYERFRDCMMFVIRRYALIHSVALLRQMG